MKKRIVTGDRPTGPLHLGHYIGSLLNRVALQDEYEQYVMIADMQALSDNFKTPEKVGRNVREVALDYLSVGIDPKKTTILVQSQIPEIAELALYLLNITTLAQLQQNPTIKDEIRQRGFKKEMPMGFLVYPVSQAADITAFGAELVPVGADQLPVLELTRQIVRKFNKLYGETLVLPRALLSKTPRLPGIDGKEKMSKSLNNTINLNDTPDLIRKKVMKMYTDPTRIRATDPGHIEGNTVFTYLDAFYPDKEDLTDLKKRYEKGLVSDVAVKEKLIIVLEKLLYPIRERRCSYENKSKTISDILIDGSKKARIVAKDTLYNVREHLHLVL